jgi:hypothetical protein
MTAAAHRDILSASGITKAAVVEAVRHHLEVFA